MVASRTGLDRLTLSVLECLDELDAHPDHRYVKSARVVNHAYASRAIPPRFVYEAMCANAATWLTHLLLVDIHGNIGSADDQDGPASPRYTEARLTRAGWLALASERGELPRLPIGLINGDLAFGGTAPSFDPVRVASALRAAVNGASDAELVELVGLPAFRIACSVDGDLAALASGASSKLSLSARVAIESDERGSRLVISHFPWSIGPGDAAEALAHRVDVDDADSSLRNDHPDLYAVMHLPLRDIRNESRDDVGRIVCELEPDADPEICREGVLETWPVTTEFTVQLGAPLAQLLREIVDGSDAQQEAITALIAIVSGVDCGRDIHGRQRARDVVASSGMRVAFRIEDERKRICRWDAVRGKRTRAGCGHGLRQRSSARPRAVRGGGGDEIRQRLLGSRCAGRDLHEHRPPAHEAGACVDRGTPQRARGLGGARRRARRRVARRQADTGHRRARPRAAAVAGARPRRHARLRLALAHRTNRELTAPGRRITDATGSDLRSR